MRPPPPSETAPGGPRQANARRHRACDHDYHCNGVDALLRLYSVPPDARRVVADGHGRLPLGTHPSVCDVHLYPRSDDRYHPVVAPAPAGCRDHALRREIGEL